MTLASRDFGDAGPPVVILHGLFGSARNWTTVAKKLGETNRVHALDLPNHGESPGLDPVGYPAMAAAVRGYLDAHGIKRAAVIGHSLGGKTAMALALLHPDAVERLLVVDIPPVRRDVSQVMGYAEAMRAIDLELAQRRDEVDAQLREAVPEDDVRAFLMQNLTRDAGGFAWRLDLDALIAGMDAIAGFPETGSTVYFGPTLVLAGETSDYVRDEHVAAIHEKFPRAVVERVPGAGHWVHADSPAAFIERAMAFLAA